jgi:hypothetical protein
MTAMTHGALRTWRGAIGLTALAGGAAVIVGCLLPWAEIFAGLVGVAGTRGLNGRLLAGAGVLIAGAAAWQLIRGGTVSRWVAGVAGAGVLGYAAWLLMRLSATLRSLGGDSMMAVRGGPGLWLVAAGGLAAFATLFLPASAQSQLVARRPGAGLAAWAADRDAAGPRRWLQAGLGAIWLLDAALQFQPFMFGRGFVTSVLMPAGMGSPAIVSGAVTGAGQLIEPHAALANAVFATVQLLLGLGLLWRRTARAALAGTIAWALAVWFLGEGLGGLLSGSASPVTGAPGAALLYALVAVLAWPPRPGAPDPGPGTSHSGTPHSGTSHSGTPDRRSPGRRSPGRRARLAWAVLWASFALLMLQPQVRAPGALRAAISGQAAGEPRWIAAIDHWAASAAGGSGLGVSVVLAAVFAVIAAGVLIPAAARPALIAGGLAALAMLVIGQDLGGIATGQGTDPGTGPLLILLAAACWPYRGTASAPAPAAARQERAQPEGAWPEGAQPEGAGPTEAGPAQTRPPAAPEHAVRPAAR